MVGGERRPRTALETLLCSRSSAECAMGGRDGWRLRKSSDGVVMMRHVSKDRWDPWDSWIMAAGKGREISEMDGVKAAGLPM